MENAKTFLPFVCNLLQVLQRLLMCLLKGRASIHAQGDASSRGSGFTAFIPSLLCVAIVGKHTPVSPFYLFWLEVCYLAENGLSEALFCY